MKFLSKFFGNFLSILSGMGIGFSILAAVSILCWILVSLAEIMAPWAFLLVLAVFISIIIAAIKTLLDEWDDQRRAAEQTFAKEYYRKMP